MKKKLLILGAGIYQVPLIETAKRQLSRLCAGRQSGL